MVHGASSWCEFTVQWCDFMGHGMVHGVRSVLMVQGVLTCVRFHLWCEFVVHGDAFMIHGASPWHGSFVLRVRGSWCEFAVHGASSCFMAHGVYYARVHGASFSTC